MSQFIDPHTGEISWHKGGRNQAPTNKSYTNYLSHPTAQYQMTFAQWEANRLKKYKPKNKKFEEKIDTNNVKQMLDARATRQAANAAFGPYKPKADLETHLFAKELIEIAELQFEAHAWSNDNLNYVVQQAGALKSLMNQKNPERFRQRITDKIEELQTNLVRYEMRIKKQVDSISPTVATKASNRINAYRNYKERFATSTQKLSKWLNQ